MFTGEICEVFQDSYSAEHLWTAASALVQVVCKETVCTDRHLRCFIKKMLLKSSQNSQENACVGVSFLINLQAWGLHIYWKKTPTEGSSCEFLGTCLLHKTSSLRIQSVNSFSLSSRLWTCLLHSMNMFRNISYTRYFLN